MICKAQQYLVKTLEKLQISFQSTSPPKLNTWYYYKYNYDNDLNLWT